MAGWLHGVFVVDWLFVFPLCGFSLSLFCNYPCCQCYTEKAPNAWQRRGTRHRTNGPPPLRRRAHQHFRRHQSDKLPLVQHFCTSATLMSCLRVQHVCHFAFRSESRLDWSALRNVMSSRTNNSNDTCRHANARMVLSCVAVFCHEQI